MGCDAGFISIVDPFLNPDGSQWTGSITYTLRYATTVAGAFVVNAEQQFNVSNGINLCLAPGLYTVVMQQSGFTFSITSEWGVPVSGGPYTVAEISSNVTLQGSFGAVMLTGTPSTGQVPTAISPTAATWQTPGGGGGGVTAVTGTAPVVSSGGATPAISVSQATSDTQGTVQPDNVSTNVDAGVLSALLQTAQISISQDDVLALFDTPQNVGPTPAAGSVNLLVGASVQVTGDANYETDDNALLIQLHDATIVEFDVLGGSTGNTNYFVANFAIGQDGYQLEASQITGLPFKITTSDQNPTGTGGPIIVTVWFVTLTGVSA